jgi:hypothetical protein
MKKLTRFLLLLPCMAGLAMGQDVKYNFDQNADFSKYKTYKWEKHPKSLDVDELTGGMLAKGFDAALAAKGLTRTDSATPDMVIVWQLAVSQEKEISTYSTDMGYGGGWGRGYYRGGMGSTMTTGSTSTINIGTVALDMYDRAEKKLVWRGIASKTIDAKAKPDKQQKNVDKAAAKMLKNYPPIKK